METINAEIRYVKMIADPPPPTWMEYYVYTPIENLVWYIFQLSSVLLGLAVISDILG